MSEEPRPPSPGDRTELQPESSQAQAKRLSTPKDVQQHPDAPPIPGYVLISPIGRGAYAQVWKAWQIRTHKWVAVKVFIQKTGVDWLFLQREVERLIRLDKHPHIVSLLDADLNGEPPYYVMDYLEAGSLERFVDPGSPAPADKALVWMEEICQALTYVHGKGLIHCDLKPANVLLDEEGRVRLADFGQSRIVTESSGALGTLFYMAPEQAAVPQEGESLQPDVRWDVYSLGTTMWAVLTGRVPHADDEKRRRIEAAGGLAERLKAYREIVQGAPLPGLAEAGAKVDPELAAITAKCAESAPEKRYKTAADVADDLLARRNLLPVSPLAQNPWYRLGKFARRHAGLLTLACAALAALVILSGRIYLDRDRLMASQAEIVRKQFQLRRDAARSYVLRAQRYVESGDDAAAIAAYAESDRIEPSRLARMNAAGLLQRQPVLRGIVDEGGGVTAAALSPDGKKLLMGTKQGKLILRDLAARRTEREFQQSRDGMVLSVAFGPDGRHAVSGGEYGQVQLWDVNADSGPVELAGHERAVYSVAFSPDGRKILSGGFDRTARLWNARTGAPMGRPLEHGGTVARTIFSADGRRFLTASPDERVARLWETSGARPAGPPIRHAGKDNMHVAALSPDGTRVLTGSLDGTAALWDAQSGRRICGIDFKGSLYTGAFSPDGRKALLGGFADNVARGSARLFDSAACRPLGEPMLHPDAMSWIVASAFSPDGRFVLTGGWDRSVHLWDASTARSLGMPLRHSKPVNRILVGPDAGLLVCLTCDNGDDALWMSEGPASVWDISKALSGPRVIRTGHQCMGIFFDPEQRRLVVRGPTAAGKAESGVWDARTGSRLWREPLSSWIYSSAASSDGRYALVVSSTMSEPDYRGPHTLRVWDAKGQSFLGPGISREKPARAGGITPDGSRVLVADGDGVWSYDARTGAPAGRALRWTGKLPAASAAAFSPDLRWGLSGGKDGVVRIFDAADGKPAADAVNLEGDAVSITRFNPRNDTFLAVSSASAQASFWNAGSGKPTGTKIDHGETIRGAMFSPDGGRVILTGIDKVRVYDAGSGRAASGVLAHPYWVFSTALSPDGKTIATAAGDGIIRLWRAQPGSLMAEKSMQDSNIVTDMRFGPDGRLLLSIGSGGEVCLWDMDSSSPIVKWQLKTGEEDGGVVAFSQDGRLAAAGSRGGDLRVWSAPDWKEAAAMAREGASFRGIRFSPDGSRLVAWSGDTAWSWVSPFKAGGSGKALRHDGPILAGELSRDGKRFHAAAGNGFHVWDLESGGLLSPPGDHAWPMPAASAWLNPDCGTVLTGGKDGALRLWDLATSGLISEVRLSTMPITFTYSRPRGGKVFLGGATEGWLWDSRSRRIIGGSIAIPKGMHLAFSATEDFFVISGVDGIVKIWETRRGTLVRKPADMKMQILDVALSPDGKTLVTGTNKDARLWDVATLEPLGPPLPNEGLVLAAEFTTDAKLLVTGGVDAARIWDMEWLRREPASEEVQRQAREVAGLRFTGEGELEEVERFPKPVAEKPVLAQVPRLSAANTRYGTIGLLSSFLAGLILILRKRLTPAACAGVMVASFGVSLLSLVSDSLVPVSSFATGVLFAGVLLAVITSLLARRGLLLLKWMAALALLVGSNAGGFRWADAGTWSQAVMFAVQAGAVFLGWRRGRTGGPFFASFRAAVPAVSVIFVFMGHGAFLEPVAVQKGLKTASNAVFLLGAVFLLWEAYALPRRLAKLQH